MRSLHSLTWRNLTAHPLRSILTALAITLGVGMVLAAAIVGQAASRSAAELSEEGLRVDLEIFSRDDTPFDKAILETLRASPDVELLSPSLRVQAEGVRPAIPRLTLLGVQPAAYQALHEPELANGAFLDKPDTIVLPMMVAMNNGLNVGDKVTVAFEGHEATLTVSGRLGVGRDAIPPHSASMAFVPLAAAQNLWGAPGQVEHIAIALRPGTSIEQAKADLAAQLGDELVIVPAVNPRSDTFATLTVQVGLAMVGLIMLFAAAFVIMNAFAMSVTARTREIGALRALGMTRRQVMVTVLAEAGLLGLIGAVLGFLTGIGLAWGVMRLRGTLDDVAFDVPWWGIVVSVTMGIAVILIGALQPARRAGRVSPLTALRTRGTQDVSGWYIRHGGRVGGVFLLVLLPGLIATAFVLQPDFFQSFAFLGAGMALTLLGAIFLMPALVSPVARLVRPMLVRRLGTAGRLAADNLSRNKLRTALTAGALTVGLTTIIVTSTILTASLKGGLNTYFGLFHEEGMIIPDIPALLASGQMTIENSMSIAGKELDPALVEAVEALDVGTLVYYGFAPVPDESSTYPGAPGTFVDPEVFLPLGNFDFFEGDADSALEMMQRGRAMLLMPIVAERLGVGVGDVVWVETPRKGAVEFTVAGIGGTSTNFTVFPYADGETYFDLAGPGWLGIVLPADGSLDVDEMLAQVEEAIAPFDDVVVFDMQDSGVGGLIQIVDQLQMMLNSLLLLAVVVAGLGVVNTMVINVAERGREIGLLRAVGATQRQVRQSVVTEAATLGLMAALIATVLGLIILVLYAVIFLPNGATSVGMRLSWETVGLALPPALRDLGIAAALSLVFGPLVAALAAYYPARQAAALDVVEATRSERVTLRSAYSVFRERRTTRSTHYAIRNTQYGLAWRNLTAHPLRSILTALAITLGVGMVLAAAIVGQAASRSAAELSNEGPRVDLEVFSRDGNPFDESVLAVLRASPDVEQVSPSLRVEADLVGDGLPTAPLTLLGVHPAAYQALHEPELANGAFLDGPDTIVLPMMIAIGNGLSVGDEITVLVPIPDEGAGEERTATLTVAGRLKLEQDIAALTEETVAYVPLDVAQALVSVSEQVDHVEIALGPGADVDSTLIDLAERIGTNLAVVRARAAEGVGVTDVLIQAGLAMVGGIMLFAAAFVIMNAFAMSVTARTREIGALRALGMTRRQVMQSVLAEAGLLGLTGALLGVGMGIGLAWGVMTALGTLDTETFAVPWWGIVVSVGMGLGVTLVGAFQPARRASRISPLAALRQQSAARESGWYVRYGGRAGALILAIMLPTLTAIALILRPSFSVALVLIGVGEIGLLIATVLVLPALIEPVAKLARPLLVRWLGTAGRLAADNLGRNKLRAVLTAGALTATLTTIIATSGLVSVMLKGGLTSFVSMWNEDGIVMTSPAELVASGEMTLDNIQSKLSETPLDPGVREALEPLVETGVIEIERLGLAPVPPELLSYPGSPGAFVDAEIYLRIGNFDFFEGDAESALEWMQRGRAVLIAPITAERLGASVGDTVPLQTSQGEVEFTIAGIGGCGTAFPVFPYADGEAYFDMAGTTLIGLIVPEGKDVDAAIARVREAVAPHDGVSVGKVEDDFLDGFLALVDQLQLLFNALLLLAVVVAGLGVVNTMVINVAERRREISLLRAVGATQFQVSRAIVAEAATLGVMAAIIGTVVSVLMLGILILVMTPGGTPSIGIRVSWEVAANFLPIGLRDMFIAAALALVFGPLVAALAAYYPARQAAALDAVGATRSERVTLRSAYSVFRERRTTRSTHYAIRNTQYGLAWRNLTAHPLRSILTALAITLGVGMVLAAAIVGQAASRSAAAISDEGPVIHLEVFSRDDTSFDKAILETLRASPDVALLSPSLRVQAEGVRPAIPRLTLLGVHPAAYQALHEPELANGAFLDEPDTVVLPTAIALGHNLNVGDKVTLELDGRVITLTVAGWLKTETGVETLAGGSGAAFVPLAVAQNLLGEPEQLDRVQIALRPSADVEQARADLAQALGPELAVVRVAAADGVLGNVMLVQAALAIVGLIILLAAGFVILNAFAMSVTARKREIGALRALGMTRRQIMCAVLTEAGLLGLLGTAAGVLAGIGLAWAVMRVMGTLEDAPFAVPWWGLTTGVLMGLGVTLIAALQPAWRASRVSPVVAARPEAAAAPGWYVRSGGRVGAVLLGLLLAGLAAYGLLGRPDIFAALAVTVVGQAALLGATMLLLPGLVEPLTRLARPLLERRLGTAGRLAADNLSRNKLRAVLTAGALTAGLTIIVATGGLMTAGLKGGISRIRSSDHEDAFVTLDLGELVAAQEMTVDNFFQFLTQEDPGFDLNPVVDALAPLVESGVIEVIRYRFLPTPSELSALPGSPGLFVEPEIYLRIGNFGFFEGDPDSALRWMQRGRAVLLPPIVAERLGVQVGDEIPVQTPRGEVMFTVAGIGGGGFMMTVLPYADAETYYGVTTPSFLGIVVAEGQDVEVALAQVQSAIDPFPRMALMDYDESLDPLLQMIDRLELLLDALLLLAVVVAAMGVVNTMVINVAERRREIGLLRAVGATQRQVRQAVMAEAATLGLLAALVASGLGLLMLLTYGVLVLPNGTASLGVRPDWDTIRLTLGAGLRDWGIAALVSLMFGPLVAALAAYYPARQAAALDVVEATRSERVTLRRAKPSRVEASRRLAPTLGVLAWRNLEQARTRTTLSTLAVALGVAMTVAADLTSSAILNALAQSEDAQIFMTGLLDQLDRMLVLVGVMITIAAGFLVFNAFAMSVTQRRRQIGALRALGMTRRQVMQTVLAEAFLTGGAGTLLGLVGGPLLGRSTIALMKIILGEGIFVFAAGSASPSILLLAAGLGMGITLLSVFIPARRATRISPLTALREETASGIERNPVGRLRLGLLVAALLFVYLALAPPGEWVSPPWDTGLTVLFVALWLGCLALILPALIGGVGRWVRRPLARLWGAAGRLTADNVRRGRGRVTLTVLTLAVALTMIASLTGFFQFVMHELFWSKMEIIGAQGALGLAPIDIMAGMSAYSDMDTIAIPPEALAGARQVAADRAQIVEFHFVIVPELSFFGNSYFSFVVEPDELRHSGHFAFRFIEGDWQTALSIMDAGCGALVMPLVAGKNGVSLGDTIQVSGADGPVECTVAGIGESFVGASIVSSTSRAAFRVTDTSIVAIIPLPGEDRDALKADLAAVTDRFQNAELMEIENLTKLQLEVMDTLPTLFNALLLLAILAAALGVVNTTVMSVAERRRELGLLRAVGATRRQVSRVVTGEAALMGLIGGGLGFFAGVGVTLILVVTYGGNAWGVPDLDLWPAAWRSVQPVLLNGLVSLIAAPFICAAAAWLPVRAILRGSAVETLNPGQRPEATRPGTKRKTAMRSLNFLALRNLEVHRVRTALSAISVALGGAMIVATGVIQSGMRNAWASGENKMSFLVDMGNVVFNGVGVIILAAAGFLIFNAFAMAVTQQRRQIGMLRSLGMTRRQVLRQVLAEAACTGGLGTLGGLLAGPLLGRGVLAAMRGMGAEVGHGSVAWGGVVLAVVMGMGITTLSALLPARRAARVSPLTALREQIGKSADRQIGKSRISKSQIFGGLILATLFIYLIIAPPGEWSGRNPPWDWIMVLLLWGAWLTGLLLVTPALLAGTVRALRAPLCRLAGTVGRLVGDNLERAPDRTTLTALTFAVGLMTMVGTAGIISFSNDVLVSRLAANVLGQTAWYVYPFNRVSGLGQLGAFDMDAPGIDAAVLQDVQRLAEGRAVVDKSYLAVVPEISSPMPGFPSFVMHDVDRLARPGNFNLIEGDWATALPLLKEGCGLLITPAVAGRHGVSVGDALTVTGLDGPVTCTVAGIGAGGFAPMAVIGPGGKDAFVAAGKPPDSLSVRPLPGTDVAALEADLYALHERYGDKAFVGKPEDELEAIVGTSDQLMTLFNGLVLLAVIAAALGTVNTTLMSVTERRRELGLLRAVGATRRQITAVVMGESALTGLIGTLLGGIAGLGLGGIFALAYGGITFGLVDLPLWQAAGETVLPALRSGWLGLVLAPLLAAGAAFPAVRTVLRGSAIETMEAKATSPKGFPKPFGAQVGSIRTRFVLGTAILLAIVLAGLIGVVATHEQSYLEEQMRDMLATMVEGQAGLIELNLPRDAQRLNLSDLQMGEFDADELLRFRALMDDVSAYGLEGFAVTDSDNVVLLSLDPRQMGDVLPKASDESAITSERQAGEWRMRASAPVRNEAGQAVGSVRLTVNLGQVQDFLRKTRNALWAVGGAIIALGLALSWALTTPLVQATQRLSAHAARVAQGDYAPFARRRRRWAGLLDRISLRARLTVAMVLVVALLVGALELVTVPIERRHTERTLKDGLVPAADWMGQAVSEGLASESLSSVPVSLDEMLSLTGTMDWAELQKLSERTQSDSMAYVALVDSDGVIQFADQLSLIGEAVSLPAETQIEESRWRDEEIWVISTPLRREQDGELIGALRMGVRRAEVEAFLDESRNLFRLTGLIALLAGVLLAQVIGGAVTAPVRRLAADVRRVGAGDLSAQFRVDARDELALLAAAFNQMVAGLREREWLRDMFGRFVSREVAEALRTGQVRLKGENRVVSVLFCDIRDFTARSARCTPEEMVALLNEYLPVVVQAAQAHEGTVNKFGGDSTLIIYGAPRKLQESAYRAVLTALEMRANLKVLNERLVERGETPIRIGVGINTGVALAGAVGPEERQEYTVIGDAVNLASRIEALNKEYPQHGILISGWTYEALGSRRSEFEFVDLGEISIRGKAEPVQVWAVV